MGVLEWEGTGNDGDPELQQALRDSLSCAAWLSQSKPPPPLHLELVPLPELTDTIPAIESENDMKLTFLGAIPIPHFLSKFQVFVSYSLPAGVKFVLKIRRWTFIILNSYSLSC